jgi:hypothetical protein
MSDREFSDIEIFQHSGKEIPLVIKIACKPIICSDRPSSYKKRINRAVVSERLRNNALIHHNLNGSVAYKRTVEVSDLRDSFSQNKV